MGWLQRGNQPAPKRQPQLNTSRNNDDVPPKLVKAPHRVYDRLTSLAESESSLSSGLGIGGIQSLGASGIGMSGAAMKCRSRMRFLWSTI